MCGYTHTFFAYRTFGGYAFHSLDSIPLGRFLYCSNASSLSCTHQPQETVYSRELYRIMSIFESIWNNRLTNLWFLKFGDAGLIFWSKRIPDSHEHESRTTVVCPPCHLPALEHCFFVDHLDCCMIMVQEGPKC